MSCCHLRQKARVVRRLGDRTDGSGRTREGVLQEIEECGLAGAFKTKYPLALQILQTQSTSRCE